MSENERRVLGPRCSMPTDKCAICCGLCSAWEHVQVVTTTEMQAGSVIRKLPSRRRGKRGPALFVPVLIYFVQTWVEPVARRAGRPPRAERQTARKNHTKPNTSGIQRVSITSDCVWGLPRIGVFRIILTALRRKLEIDALLKLNSLFKIVNPRVLEKHAGIACGVSKN